MPHNPAKANEGENMSRNKNLPETQCQTAINEAQHYRDRIPSIVKKLTATCNNKGCFEHIDAEPIPSRRASIDILHQLGRILYPGYFIHSRLDRINLEYYLGQEVVALYEDISEQIMRAIRHDCRRNDRACTDCAERGNSLAVEFLSHLPALRETLAKDIQAAYDGDPAAKGYDEVIFSYPGLMAITTYRIAHILYGLQVPFIPRIMTEYAHSRTGIDIHPGAVIGERFFIDHGTGVVIGETTVIGNRVRLYQGVTLGAISLSPEECNILRDRKRHPTIEDDVIIYANATVLGGATVIGAGSVIGGNVWITHSVTPDTQVFLEKQDLIFGENKYKDQAIKKRFAIKGQRQNKKK
jgi:serine O-acetyltransferase